MLKINYELYTFCIQALVSMMMIFFCFNRLLDKNLTGEDKVLYGSWLTAAISAWSINPGSRKSQGTTNTTYIDSGQTSVDTNSTIVTDGQQQKHK